jgi:hypothetical protein
VVKTEKSRADACSGILGRLPELGFSAICPVYTISFRLAIIRSQFDDFMLEGKNRKECEKTSGKPWLSCGCLLLNVKRKIQERV